MASLQRASTLDGWRRGASLRFGNGGHCQSRGYRLGGCGPLRSAGRHSRRESSTIAAISARNDGTFLPLILLSDGWGRRADARDGQRVALLAECALDRDAVRLEVDAAADLSRRRDVEARESWGRLGEEMRGGPEMG